MVLHEYGGPDDLARADQPDPKVAPGEVLIGVRAAGVNPVDHKVGAGYLDAMLETRFPLIPGWDVAGVVEDVGLDTGEFAPGDEVMGYIRKDEVGRGAYAERVAAHVRMLAPKPAALDWAQAGGLPLAGLTAHQSLNRVNAGSGDTVLVHAAAGGVDSLGTQLALARGARVIGTASERNHEFLRGLGAEPVTHGPGLVDRVRALAPGGVDAALDLVGDDAVDVSQQVLADPARVVSIADPQAGAKGSRYLWVRPSASDLAELGKLADSGQLTVHVERTFPLSGAGDAWRASQSGRTRGKLVLTVD